MKNIIAIYVSGGVVQEVRTNSKRSFDIQVFDVDNLLEDKAHYLIEEEWDKLKIKCPKELPI